MAMKQSEILGLFTSPQDIQRSVADQLTAQASQQYRDPIAQQLYRGAGQLAGGIARQQGRMLAGEAEAQRIQDIQRSVTFDPDDVEGYYSKLAERLTNAGLTKAGAQALKLASQSKSADPSTTAAMRQYEFYKSLTPEQQIVYDRAQGRTLTPEQIRIAEEAKSAGRVTGKTRAEATLSLPEVESTIEETQTSIDYLLDPENEGAVKGMTGLNSMFPLVPGTDRFDANRQFEQLKGQLSLSQYEKLKGAGQITETELQVASDAISKIDRGLSYKAFTAELKKLKKILDKAKERAVSKAGSENVKWGDI